MLLARGVVILARCLLCRSIVVVPGAIVAGVRRSVLAGFTRFIIRVRMVTAAAEQRVQGERDRDENGDYRAHSEAN